MCRATGSGPARAFGLALGTALLLAGCATIDRPPPPAPVRAPAMSAPAAKVPSPARWHAARVVADAPMTGAALALVAPGETLAALARARGVSPGAIAVANGLAPPYVLVPGRRLTIPAGRWHRVKPGETGAAIARAYRVPFAAFARVNALLAPYTLEVGDRLLVPVPALPRPRARSSPQLRPASPDKAAGQPAASSPAAPPPAAPPPATVEARANAYNLDIDRLLGKELPAARPRAHSRARVPGADAPTTTDDMRAGVTAANPTTIARPAPPPTEPAIAQPTGAIRLDWPVDGRLLSGFGAKPGGRFNDGINIAVVAGAPVRAAADGVVAYAGTGVAAFGGLILLRHAGGWLTAYAHCEVLLVAKGEAVRHGSPIARAGATGEVDAPQLHFEVRRGRTPVDPLRLLPPRQAPDR